MSRPGQLTVTGRDAKKTMPVGLRVSAVFPETATWLPQVLFLSKRQGYYWNTINFANLSLSLALSLSKSLLAYFLSFFRFPRSLSLTSSVFLLISVFFHSVFPSEPCRDFHVKYLGLVTREITHQSELMAHKEAERNGFVCWVVSNLGFELNASVLVLS